MIFSRIKKRNLHPFTPCLMNIHFYFIYKHSPIIFTVVWKNKTLSIWSNCITKRTKAFKQKNSVPKLLCSHSLNIAKSFYYYHSIGCGKFAKDSIYPINLTFKQIEELEPLMTMTIRNWDNILFKLMVVFVLNYLLQFLLLIYSR